MRPDQSVTYIFEYSNILITNIYSDIHLCQICYTNIFGYSFVSNFWYKYIRIFVCVKMFTNVTLWARLLTAISKQILMTTIKNGPALLYFIFVICSFQSFLLSWFLPSQAFSPQNQRRMSRTNFLGNLPTPPQWRLTDTDQNWQTEKINQMKFFSEISCNCF